MNVLRRTVERHKALLSYVCRSAVCIGFASLLPVLTDASPRAAALFGQPLFAPVFVAVSLAPVHVGAVLKNAAAILQGWTVGCCLTVAATVAAHAAHGSRVPLTYSCLTLLMLLILYPEDAVTFSPLAQKMAADCVIISLFNLPVPTTLGRVALFPCRLLFSVVAGVLPCALINALLPWPASRACPAAEALLADARRATGELLALLCRALGEGAASQGAARALEARAHALRAAAETCVAAAAALAEPCDWEAYAGLASRRQPLLLRLRVVSLRQLLLAADGVLSALSSLRSAEAQHERAVERARMYQRQQVTDPSSARAGDGDLDRIDELLGPAVASLGAAAARAVAQPEDDDSLAAMLAAEAGLALKLQSARRAIYYSPAPPSFAQASITSYGPPVEHYAFFECLRIMSAAIGDWHDINRVEAVPPPRRTPGQMAGALLAWIGRLSHSAIAPFTRPLNWARAVYACKLVAAVVVSAALGELTSGSGSWAAITAQIVGARASINFGGSFRTALARLHGTLAGAAFGFIALGLLRPASHEHPGLLMILLTLWAALLAAPRTSARHAYACLVSQFVPFIIVLGGNPAASSSRAAAESGSALNSKEVAYMRIEQNVLGILVFVAVEILVMPRWAASLLPAALASALHAASQCASVAWAPLLASGPQCAACAAGQCARSAEARLALAASLARLDALATEAAEEPPWLSSRAQSSVRALVSLLQARLARLSASLSLMQLAAAQLSAARAGAAPRLVAPLRPAARALRCSLAALLQCLSEEMAVSCSSARAIAAAAACDRHLERFERLFVRQLLRLREDHLRDAVAEPAAEPPPLRAVMPLEALLFFTRDVRADVDVVGAAVREYLGVEGQAGAGEEGAPDCESEEDGEGEEDGEQARLCECGASVDINAIESTRDDVMVEV